MKDQIGFILPLLITVVGWFIGSWLTDRSRRKQDQKDKMYNFLTEAYFSASKIRSNDFDSQDELMEHLFEITNKVSLYGSKEQIALMSEFFKEVSQLLSSGNKFDQSTKLHNLVKELRKDIRLHLELTELKEDVPNLAKP